MGGNLTSIGGRAELWRRVAARWKSSDGQRPGGSPVAFDGSSPVVVLNFRGNFGSLPASPPYEERRQKGKQVLLHVKIDWRQRLRTPKATYTVAWASSELDAGLSLMLLTEANREAKAAQARGNVELANWLERKLIGGALTRDGQGLVQDLSFRSLLAIGSKASHPCVFSKEPIEESFCVESLIQPNFKCLLTGSVSNSNWTPSGNGGVIPSGLVVVTSMSSSICLLTGSVSNSNWTPSGNGGVIPSGLVVVTSMSSSIVKMVEDLVVLINILKLSPSLDDRELDGENVRIADYFDVIVGKNSGGLVTTMLKSTPLKDDNLSNICITLYCDIPVAN
ncbi:hypothetical protein IEQ34_009249 [Dendrobium chrysotoxum]|uniref:Uncharacterized protein n=1 Tax=Dendrobium chrysotoxum TaxID=161865 RepID=A0AAV7H1Y2_DENCH|nr:hypothetical protein IEQ34_009249 [Dendrobium chrysotoxum]